jgi:hypothetical protein
MDGSGARGLTPLAGAPVPSSCLLRDDPNAGTGRHNGRDRRRSPLKPRPASET